MLRAAAVGRVVGRLPAAGGVARRGVGSPGHSTGLTYGGVNSGAVSLSSHVMSAFDAVPIKLTSSSGSARNFTTNYPTGGDAGSCRKCLSSLLVAPRKFSTGQSLGAVAEPSLMYDPPCPQGIQGDDCVHYKLWLANCQRYQLRECAEQMEGLQSGRKTLSEVFREQDELIQKIVEDFKADESASHHSETYTLGDTIAIQGTQGEFNSEMEAASIEQLARLENPCPQGVQGDNCTRYKLWLENCLRYGFGNCNEQLHGLRAGTRNLSDIFREQDQMIRMVGERYQRESAATEKEVSGGGDSGQKVSGNPTGESGSGSGSGSSDGPSPPVALSQKERLKRAVREYGATVIVFHVCISLISLGGFYLAVSSEIDMVALLDRVGLGKAIGSAAGVGASTFVVAYAVHKVFAPVRMAITLTSTPFIVRHLRRIGFLKPPKPK